jgi:hypothetical protein
LCPVPISSSGEKYEQTKRSLIMKCSPNLQSLRPPGSNSRTFRRSILPPRPGMCYNQSMTLLPFSSILNLQNVTFTRPHGVTYLQNVTRPHGVTFLKTSLFNAMWAYARWQCLHSKLTILAYATKNTKENSTGTKHKWKTSRM